LDSGVPAHVVDFLENVNNSSVQLGEDLKLDESSQISRKEVRKVYKETDTNENQITIGNNVFEPNPDFEGDTFEATPLHEDSAQAGRDRRWGKRF